MKWYKCRADINKLIEYIDEQKFISSTELIDHMIQSFDYKHRSNASRVIGKLAKNGFIIAKNRAIYSIKKD